jgi:hypothetical protein
MLDEGATVIYFYGVGSLLSEVVYGRSFEVGPDKA